MRSSLILLFAAFLIIACGSDPKPGGVAATRGAQGNGVCPQFELRNAICVDSDSKQTPYEKISFKGNVIQATNGTDTHTETYPHSETDENGVVSEDFCDSGKVVMLETFQGNTARSEMTYSPGVLSSKGQSLSIACTQTGDQPKKCEYAGASDFTFTCRGRY